MKTRIPFLFFGLLCISFSVSNAQTPVLSFDGIDDYVDLGSTAGNGFRTIEMWFKPASVIDSTLSDFATLAAREISPANNNHEFSLSFQPSSNAHPGALRFDVNGTQPAQAVYSDSTHWQAGRWYHVAAVIHPTWG